MWLWGWLYGTNGFGFVIIFSIVLNIFAFDWQQLLLPSSYFFWLVKSSSETVLHSTTEHYLAPSWLRFGNNTSQIWNQARNTLRQALGLIISFHMHFSYMQLVSCGKMWWGMEKARSRGSEICSTIYHHQITKSIKLHSSQEACLPPEPWGVWARLSADSSCPLPHHSSGHWEGAGHHRGPRDATVWKYHSYTVLHAS